MATKDTKISIAEAITPAQLEPSADVTAWHMRVIAERHKAADKGRFASQADVKAVIRKFIPDG